MALLAMAIDEVGKEAGVRAKSFTGQQAGILTTEKYGKAHISAVLPDRILKTLDAGHVAVVAGFQGVHQQSNDVTTLGRGGSDTTAVAIAAAVGADICEIFSDVDGVFTADPRIVPTARQLPFLSYEEMLELAASGAKILALRCVEYTRRFNVKVHVRSSFSDKTGTIICSEEEMLEQYKNNDMEAPVISGVAHDSSESMITLIGLPDSPGIAAQVFEEVAKNGINVDMIVQNISKTVQGKTDLSFTVPQDSANAGFIAMQGITEQLGSPQILLDNNVGKLSLVGAGMKTNPGVSATFFAALRDAGVNVEMISTSEVRISVIIRLEELEAAVRALHTAFELDSNDDAAVVYGGSGR
jgi:aspartate kinase